MLCSREPRRSVRKLRSKMLAAGNPSGAVAAAAAESFEWTRSKAVRTATAREGKTRRASGKRVGGTADVEVTGIGCRPDGTPDRERLKRFMPSAEGDHDGNRVERATLAGRAAARSGGSDSEIQAVRTRLLRSKKSWLDSKPAQRGKLFPTLRNFWPNRSPGPLLPCRLVSQHLNENASYH